MRWIKGLPVGLVKLLQSTVNISLPGKVNHIRMGLKTVHTNDFYSNKDRFLNMANIHPLATENIVVMHHLVVCQPLEGIFIVLSVVGSKLFTHKQHFEMDVLDL